MAFLVYSPADVALRVAGFALGPKAGLVATAVVCLLQAPLYPEGGWFGAIMHFIASAALVAASSIICSRNRTKRGAHVAMAAGAVAMIAVMTPANLLLIPVFHGLPRSAVVSVIWWIAAFNVLKVSLNVAIAALHPRHPEVNRLLTHNRYLLAHYHHCPS